MRRRRSYNFILVLGLVLFLSVGYAVVNSVSLTITGSSSAVTSNLGVYFNGDTYVSNSSKVTASATNGSTSASISVNNLTLNESVTATYTVYNSEIDVGANVKVSDISFTNSEYFSVTTDAASGKSLGPSSTNTITVTVTMVQTPITSSNSTSNITISIDAVPTNMFSFNIDGVVYNAVNGMTWGEWVNSSYNVGNYTTNGYYIFDTSGVTVTDGSSTVAFNQTIIAGEYYYSIECCFDPGTKILMADGSEKNIEDVEIGDMVMSLNEDTGEFIAQRVSDTIINKKSTDLVYVYLSNGVRIGMRAYHPLLTTKGYKTLRPNAPEVKRDLGNVRLGELKVGDTLVGYERNVMVLSVIKRIEVEDYYTYNLSVEGYHNYIANGVVVHNASCKN